MITHTHFIKKNNSKIENSNTFEKIYIYIYDNIFLQFDDLNLKGICHQTDLLLYMFETKLLYIQ